MNSYLELLNKEIKSKNSKLYNLINICTKQDIDKLKKTIKKDLNPTLVKLFNLLQNSSLEPAKNEVWDKLYKTSYTKDKDYILRNDYRLLSDYIEKNLYKWLESDNIIHSKNMTYLQKIIEAKNWDLFIVEYKHILQTTLNKKHISEMNDLLRNIIHYIIPQTSEKFKLILDLHLSHFEEKKKELDNQLFQLFPAIGMVEKVINNDIEHPNEKISNYIRNTNNITHIAQYYKLKYEQYYLRGTELISHCEKAILILSKYHLLFTDFESEYIWCRGTIAMEYMLLSKPKLSLKNHELILEKFPNSQLPIFTYQLVNLMHVYLKLEKYEMAINIFKKYENQFLKLQKSIQSSISLVSLSYLFLDDSKNLKKILSNYDMIFNESDWDYFRILKILCYINEKDYIAADYEIKNLKRVRKITEEYYYLTAFIPVIQEFIAFEEKKSINYSRHKLEKKLMDFTKNENAFRYYSLLIHYINYKCNILN